VIVGITRDAHHGPVTIFGLGGVLVELIGDVAFRTVPITTDDAKEMMVGPRYAAALEGVRGAARADRDALADLLVKVARIAQQHR